MNRPWWSVLDQPMRGLVELAAVPNREVRASIVAAVCPSYGSSIEAMAADLAWIERLEVGDNRTLSEFYGDPVNTTWIQPDVACDEAADELKASVRTSAELVAAVLTVRTAA